MKIRYQTIGVKVYSRKEDNLAQFKIRFQNKYK
jgi:hypothetical protein